LAQAVLARTIWVQVELKLNQLLFAKVNC